MRQQKNNKFPQNEEKERSMTNNLKEQTFYFDNGKIRYLNTQQNISFLNDYLPNKFEVKNYTCTQDKNKLTKVTKVVIDNEEFFLRDQFSIEPVPHKRKQSQDEDDEIFQPEKKHPIHRRDNYSHLGNGEKRDTKNLVKNVITIFFSWVKAKAETDQSYQTTIKKISDKLIQIKYYNKTFLHSLAEDLEICEHFLHFCRHDAQNMIEGSRVKDKASHKVALEHYRKIFENNENRIKEGKGSSNGRTKD